MKGTTDIEYKGVKLSVYGIYYPFEKDTNSRSEFDIKAINVYDSFVNIIELISDEDLDNITDCVISILE